MVLSYKYTAAFLNLKLKNIIQWKNHFQNAKEKLILVYEIQEA